MPESQKAPTLAELSEDILSLTFRFREKTDSVDYDTLYQGMSTLLEEFDRKAKNLRLDSEDVADSRYALAAFVDEVVLRSQWTGKEQWADNPLQLRLFETYVAGEGFFEKLETLRERGESAAEVLEVYYLCLVLGFEGKYGIEGTERLSALAKLVHDELNRYRPSPQDGISPHWKIVDGPAQETSRLPRWLVYSCAVVILACVLLYIGLFIRIRVVAGDLVQSRAASVLIQAAEVNWFLLC